MDLSFATADVTCNALARTSGFDPSSLITAPRYLNCVTISSSYLPSVILVLTASSLFAIIFAF